ncbi:MAG: von Willebrand factor type [Pseudomonadota bacterium]
MQSLQRSEPELFNKVPDSGSRAVILLSDGAGRIDAATQEKIKDWFGRLKISLYWIVLRQPGGISIFNTSFKARDDDALPPQIELNEFFKSLNSPFQAYEAEDPKTLQKAFEKIPGQDYSTHCFVTAALLMIALLTLKLIEVRSWL